MTLKLFPYLLVGYLLLISLDSALFGSLYSPIYAMHLSNCDPTKIHGYHERRWRYVLGHGLCPPPRQIEEDRDIKVVYSHCIPWESDVWAEIDSGNLKAGYRTNIANNASNWSLGYYLYLTTAICYAFSIVIINVAVLLQSTMSETDNKKPSRDTEDLYFWIYMCYNGAVISMVAGYATWIVGMYMLRSSRDMTASKTWETYYYNSCSVRIYDLGETALEVFGSIIPLVQLGLLLAYVSQFNSRRIDFVANQYADGSDFGDLSDAFLSSKSTN